MITNLSKLDADMERYREDQLNEYLDEPDKPDTEHCAICGNYYPKDDCVRVHGDWVCENCQKGVGE